MNWPELSQSQRVARLEPPAGPVDMVLDTDTYNEVDDQFAVCHALLSPQRLRVEAITAAPFHNNRSTGPGDGMEKSHAEILRLLERLNVSPDGLVFRGSTDYLADRDTPQRNDAVDRIVELGMAEREGPLYVAPIGAITNVASALLIEPRLVQKIVIVWLGGHGHDWPDTREFNLKQDVPAAQVVFDSGVPLVQMPVMGVVDRIHTTLAELEACLGESSAIAQYLIDTVRGYHDDHFAWSKVIWDIAATAWLVEPKWIATALKPTPRVTSDVTWSFDPHRPLMRVATHVDRNAIFRDVFTKLRNAE